VQHFQALDFLAQMPGLLIQARQLLQYFDD